MSEKYQRYNPDVLNGLSGEQVETRIQQGLVNGDGNVPSKSVSMIIRDNVCTLFNLVNAILALAILLTGHYKNLLFMGVIVCNVIIGTFQEVRAKRTVDKLSILAASKVQVVRGGKVLEISDSELVLDDVVLLNTGMQVAADCVVLGGSCEVNESLVTGESDSIFKKEGDTMLSGSYLVSGACRARADRIGADSYARSISKDAKYIKKVRSVIMDALNRIVKGVSILIVPVGLLLFWRQMAVSNLLDRAVVSTAAALIGMIPEGLVLLVSTVLAVSVVRLSRHKVLVQELFCIETLARVDVLCLDKTGTITDGKIELEDIIPQNGTKTEINEILQAICAAFDDISPTFLALKKHFSGQNHWKTKGVLVPFSSERKWSGVSFEDRGSFVLGAPEFVMPQMPEALKLQVQSCAAHSRVLMLAHSDEPFDGAHLPEGLECAALLLFQDVIRPEAAQTLEFFAEQGVEIKVISGDNPATVSAIAARAGLSGAESYVDATTLHTQQDIENAVEQYTVFGRVTPVQKKQMVQALQRKGYTVGMTGDGVNDVLALKEADCSIAMAAGSDAARNVSQLVLLDNSFSAMPHVVAEGRRTVNNIERSASLFLVKTVYTAVLAVLFLFIHAPYPFMPIQLTLISVTTIGIPSFVLALEPNKERIQVDFIWHMLSRALPGAGTVIANVLAVTALSEALGLSGGQASTICVITTGFAGLMVVFAMCLPFNRPFRYALFIFVACVFAGGVLFFPGLFSLVVLPVWLIVILLIIMAAEVPVFLLLTAAFRRFGIKKELEK